MIKLALSFCCLAICFNSNAQICNKVDIQLVFDNQPLIANSSIYNPITKDSLIVTKLMFYLSNIVITFENDSTYYIENHLFDLTDNTSFTLTKIDNKHYIKKIKFNLGIDSTTNYSGAQTGNLDPLKGMYWAWHSGYINFKIEGKCQNNQQEYNYHIGGYNAPYNSIQKFEFNRILKRDLTIQIAIEKLLYPMFLAKQYKIMSPGKLAMNFAENFQKALSIH